MFSLSAKARKAHNDSPEEDKLEFEDEHCVIVTDLKSLDEKKRTAKAHFQCIPKRHIRDIHHLKASDEKLIKHME